MDKDNIKQVALERLAKQGYHATTLRQLAKDLGVTPAAFYYHYKTKEDLLSEILTEILRDDIAIIRALRVQFAPDPLDGALYYHGFAHATQPKAALVVRREVAFLPRKQRMRVRELIHTYENEFAECIGADYDIADDDLWVVTKMVLGMGGSVAEWYEPSGKLDPVAMAELFVAYARGICAAAGQLSLASVQSNGQRFEGIPDAVRAVSQSILRPV